MKQLQNQHSMSLKCGVFKLISAVIIAAFISGCGGDSASDNGQIVSDIRLPTGPFNSLYCPDIGVGDENCVLYDPSNPYVELGLNNTTKWDYSDQANTITDPESARKSSFYVWATILAKAPEGENQFYTADSLHRIFVEEGSTVAQAQAIRAYRAVLDNFYGSVTYDANQNDFQLKDWVGDRLVLPAGGLTQLFADQTAAEQALNDWGYIYNTGTRTMSKATN